MSLSDPLTLKCCFCGAEQNFADQAQASSVWSVEENAKGEIFALCPKDLRNQLALDTKMCLVMGKPIPERSDINGLQKEERQEAVKGVKIRARFKLESIDVEVGGKVIAGSMDETNDLLKSLDTLEVGKEYSITLR